MKQSGPTYFVEGHLLKNLNDVSHMYVVKEEMLFRVITIITCKHFLYIFKKDKPLTAYRNLIPNLNCKWLIAILYLRNVAVY
jgi:hypothetical protein